MSTRDLDRPLEDGGLDPRRRYAYGADDGGVPGAVQQLEHGYSLDPDGPVVGPMAVASVCHGQVVLLPGTGPHPGSGAAQSSRAGALDPRDCQSPLRAAGALVGDDAARP